MSGRTAVSSGTGASTRITVSSGTGLSSWDWGVQDQLPSLIPGRPGAAVGALAPGQRGVLGGGDEGLPAGC